MIKSPVYFLLLFVLAVSCTSQRISSDRSTAVPIFDKKVRDQWKGAAENWRWEGDVLVGETTVQHAITRSSFFVWDKKVKDFILDISFRISEKGNSGIYYRCERGAEGYDELLGYQADIDGQNDYTGVVYENFMGRHRKILAKRGEFIRISPEDSIRVFPVSLTKNADRKLIHTGDWNQYELIVKGSLIVQKLNGQVISMVEDLARNRVTEGLFGFQLHQGPPMKVEFRDAVFRDLSR